MAEQLTMTRGDTKRLRFTVRATDESGQPGDPIDLSGKILRFTAKTSRALADDAATIRHDNDTLGGVSLVDAPNGIAEVTIQPAETAGLTGSIALPWDLQLTDGAVVTTVADGILTVFPDVTRS